ncbi:MAG: 4'-phosphopantetheinyl transferase superfamily protein [Bacteroidota bacterium]|nr:4'-phosphopantetheinyl transferase superfamily protein [Bacteroidota bacterium]
MIEIRNINPHLKLGLLDLKVFSLSNNYILKRDLEKAATKLLLSSILNDPLFELCYTPTNKPFLKDSNAHISISHSHDKLAVIFNSKENTGIDIELIRNKILNITHKFLNEVENEYAGEDLENLTFIWAAKETLYKIYGLKGLDFKLNLSVEMSNNDTLFGNITIDNYQKCYLLKKEKIQNYCLVYALNEI